MQVQNFEKMLDSMDQYQIIEMILNAPEFTRSYINAKRVEHKNNYSYLEVDIVKTIWSVFSDFKHDDNDSHFIYENKEDLINYIKRKDYPDLPFDRSEINYFIFKEESNKYGAVTIEKLVEKEDFNVFIRYPKFFLEKFIPELMLEDLVNGMKFDTKNENISDIFKRSGGFLHLLNRDKLTKLLTELSENDSDFVNNYIYFIEDYSSNLDNLSTNYLINDLNSYNLTNIHKAFKTVLFKNGYDGAKQFIMNCEFIQREENKDSVDSLYPHAINLLDKEIDFDVSVTSEKRLLKDAIRSKDLYQLPAKRFPLFIEKLEDGELDNVEFNVHTDIEKYTDEEKAKLYSLKDKFDLSNVSAEAHFNLLDKNAPMIYFRNGLDLKRHLNGNSYYELRSMFLDYFDLENSDKDLGILLSVLNEKAKSIFTFQSKTVIEGRLTKMKLFPCELKTGYDSLILRELENKEK